jgi:hypothetical protein
MPAHVVQQPGVLGFLESLRRRGGIPAYQGGGQVTLGPGFGRLIGEFLNVVDHGISKLGEAVEAIGQAMTELIQSHSAKLRGVQDSLLEVRDNLAKMSNDLSMLQQATKGARGGLLGGRGTGTSDSNLAWVSRGEYITPAYAVAQPGVLAFLEALRRSGGNLSAVLESMGRFAFGGLVTRPALAFAARGGLVGSGSSRDLGTLRLVTDEGTVTGLADARIVEALRRQAALGQVRSGGRKPSRYS